MIITFNEYNNNNIDFNLLYENIKTKKNFNVQHKKLINQTLSDYNLNLYFSLTFGTALPFLIPIIEKLFYNKGSISIDTYEIVLLTIFSITEIIHVNNDNIKRLKNDIKEKGILHLVDKIKKSLQSIYKITLNVAFSFGKVIEKFIEMFSYITISIPIWYSISEITSQEGFDIDTFPQKLLGLTIGTGGFYLKNIINKITNSLINKKNNLK
jgi:hypothetical protein